MIRDYPEPETLNPKHESMDEDVLLRGGKVKLVAWVGSLRLHRAFNF